MRSHVAAGSLYSRARVRAVAVAVALSVGAAAAPALGATGALLHTGGSNCTGKLVEAGNGYQGECVFPFQGFPLGVAGMYDSEPNDPLDTNQKAAEVHVELLARMSSGPPRALGVECEQYGKGVARCEGTYNPFEQPITTVEPVPAEIVEIVCAGHSHAQYSTFAKPGGTFACWSTDEARADLEKDGYFRDNGFPPPGPGPTPEPEPGPLGPLSGVGVTGQITTVPVNTYLPDTLVVSRSLGLNYVNFDNARHDVVALDDKRPDGSAPWCGTFENPDNPSSKDCPLFWSKLIPGGGTQTPVLGLEDTVVGESYRFYCSIHPLMVGTIQVAE